MARKATGSKEWRVRLQTWIGRIRGDDGKRTPWRDLGTDNPALAQERLDAWIATGDPPSLANKEAFSAAAERIIDKQEARGEKGACDRRRRIHAFALPVIGHIEVAELEPHHVYSVLERMGEQKLATKERYAADTVHHMRVDISRVLTELVREGVLKTNAARDVELPDDVEVDDRPRVVLTDAEINEFRVKRGFERELDMMALFSRDVGGHRTSDLHAADYADVDTVNWKTILVRRPKTDREGSRKGRRKGRRRATRGYERVRTSIPEHVVAPLKAWWAQHGSPKSGPIFPLRRGPNAGKRKTGKGISYVEPLRDALWEACIYRPLPGFESAVGDERRKFCALQVDTDETRAVDFHSFRRAYVTALANSGLNAQTAMALSGHSDMATHQRYIAQHVLAVPASALPASVQGTATPDSRATQSSKGAGETAAQEGAPAPADTHKTKGAEVSVSSAATGIAPTVTTPTSAPADTQQLGRELTSTPPADLGGVRSQAPAGLQEVLEQLLVVLRGGAVSAVIDPGPGSNDALTQVLESPNPEGFPRRARCDSNTRPTAPEAVALSS